MSKYPKEYCIARPVRWPVSPSEMSISLLYEIEDCPHKWALERADYPQIWDGRGYPSRVHIPSITGTIKLKRSEVTEIGWGNSPAYFFV